MRKRKPWHEYADALEETSLRFRGAHLAMLNERGPTPSNHETEMRRLSVEGTEILLALALALRTEQDFKLVPRGEDVVGALKKNGATPADAHDAKEKGGYRNLLDIGGYSPLTLREALNKIAHADPQTQHYYVSRCGMNHEVLLFGCLYRERWFAAVSVPRLVEAIRALPDQELRGTEV